MGINWFITKFSNIGNQTALRFDSKYREFWDVNKGNFISSKNPIPFYEILEEIKVTKLKKGELDKDYYLLNISDQQPKVVFLENLKEVNEIGSDKNPLWESDVIISKLGLPKGYIFLNDKENFPKLIGSTELIPYKLKSDKYIPKFIVYFLLLDNVLKCFSALESGKTPSHKRVSPNDLLKTNFPLVSKENQDKSLKKIEPIEDQIKHLKSQIQDPLAIINKVFAEEFKFDLNSFENAKNQCMQVLNLSDYANNKDLRCGIRFHNPAYKFLHGHLTGLFQTKIKDFISEPIVLGKGISPTDYDEKGEYYYISMADIRNWYFNQKECKTIRDGFYRSNFNKSFAMNDIVMARSGEGTIGKVAIIQDEEIEGLFADFTMRIRLRNYNPLLAYYYFRSDFFQYYIYTHKKGLGNNTNIFPSQVREFPIPDFSEKKQKSIVEKIKSELDKQKEIEREIDEKQKEISRIIEAAIKG